MKYTSQMIDTAIFPSDNEIRSLAALSKKIYAEIKENKFNGNYQMTIYFPEDNTEKIIVASKNFNEYQDMVRTFYKYFIKYGGSINLEEIFRDS